VIDYRLKKGKKMNITNPYLRRLSDELPAVIFGIGAVIGCFIGYRAFRREFKDPTN
jgi:hypothetical protein